MRTIILEIDAGEKMCGKCKYLGFMEMGLLPNRKCPICTIFNVSGNINTKNMERPIECLNADEIPQ